MRQIFNVRQRNYIILGLCSILLIMAAGYAAFRTQLNINGTSNITSEWKVLITNIQSQIVNGTPEDEAGSPSHTNTTANFSTKLYSPGDRMQYTVTVENGGSIDAVLKTIETTDSNNNAILFEIDRIEEGEVLKAGEETSFTVDVAYNSSTTEQPENLTSDLEVTLNYEQATGEEEEVGNSTNIGGNKVAITESGDGLYSDEYTSGRYVYRGSNPDNYIKLGEDMYRIISKETDGTYKVIKKESIGKFKYDLEYGNENTRYSSIESDYCYKENNEDYKGCNVWSSKYDTLDANLSTVTTMEKNLDLTEKYNLPSNDSYINTYLNNNFYNGLSNNVKSLIVKHNFNIGHVLFSDKLEDTLRTESEYIWQGKIGLLNISDYIKANSNINVCNSVNSYNENAILCSETNYLYSENPSFSISPRPLNVISEFVFAINYSIRPNNPLHDYTAYNALDTYPVFYINAAVKFLGNGTENNPYQII